MSVVAKTLVRSCPSKTFLPTDSKQQCARQKDHCKNRKDRFGTQAVEFKHEKKITESRRCALYGLEAISAQNGWAMAIAGALIVIAGLTVLSLVISQLHKIAGFLEKGVEKRSEKKQAVKITPKEAVVPKPPAFNTDEAQARLKPLVAELGESFELTNLYELANRGELPHVHLSIRSLRESGVIVSAGEGRFVWRD
jgi:hypothetical protein